MERVVYLLGAGFSAPLGLPVIRDFVDKAKGLHRRHKTRYPDFEEIFALFKKHSECMSFYVTNLYNLEEVLSLLEMRALLEGDITLRTKFGKFIADVIEGHTPPYPPPPFNTGGATALFGPEPWTRYGFFAAVLFNLSYKSELSDDRGYIWKLVWEETDPSHEYAVVTLNYDLVLEKAAEYLSKVHGIDVRFCRNLKTIHKNGEFAHYLAKLHGSVDSAGIVPPTWNKKLEQGETLTAWKLAYHLFKQANHIRIIGYSLPEADSYVRDLLRASILENEHLERIDVLCRDDSQKTVQKRYEAFVASRLLRFQPADLIHYLDPTQCRFDATQVQPAHLKEFEPAHSAFFSH